MITKLPGYHLTIGGLFFLAGLVAKQNLPHHIGLAPSIQLPCAFFSSVLFAMGTFLALGALVLQTECQRKLLGELLCGLVLLPILLSFYFFTCFMLSRTVEMVKSPPNVLPKMVEIARSFPKEEQRRKTAGYAYQFYGTIIAYPLDDNQVVYYVPSQEDKNKRQQMEEADALMKKSTAIIEKTMLQFPYLFALYACTYFSAFLAGGMWLVLKTPKLSMVPKS